MFDTQSLIKRLGMYPLPDVFLQIFLFILFSILSHIFKILGIYKVAQFVLCKNVCLLLFDSQSSIEILRMYHVVCAMQKGFSINS